MKERPTFAPDGSPVNRAARRALVALDKRFRRNQRLRGDEFAARRLAEQAERLKDASVVLGVRKASPRQTLAQLVRAARDAAVTADGVESLPPASSDVTAMGAPVDVVALGKAPAPGDAEPEAAAPADFPMPGVRARGLRALAPADAVEAGR